MLFIEMRHTNWHFFSIMPLCLLLSEGLLSLGWAFIPLYITQWDETPMRAQTLCHGIVRANSKIGFKCHCCILSKKPFTLYHRLLDLSFYLQCLDNFFLEGFLETFPLYAIYFYILILMFALRVKRFESPVISSQIMQ